jgi:hypothetical protein
MFTTTDFHNFWFIHADFLEALFTIVGLMSAIWLIKELYALVKNRGKTSVQYLVEIIKNSREE